MRKLWQLENDRWKYDIMPEIMDGRNVADFVDPDIEAQLAQLEKEEDDLAAAAALEVCALLASCVDWSVLSGVTRHACHQLWQALLSRSLPDKCRLRSG